MARRPRLRPAVLGALVVAAFAGSPVNAAADPGNVGAWSIDTFSGITAGQLTTPDASGLSNTGVDGNGANFGPGRFGNAVELGAPGHGFRVNDAASLRPASVSALAWVKRLGTPGPFRTIIGKGGLGCSDSAYAIYSGAGGGLQAYVTVDRSATHTVVLTPAVAAASVWDGQWHAVGMTFSAASGDVVLYLDGQQAASTTSTGGALDYFRYTEGRLGVGRYPDAACSLAGFQYTGLLDEVRIYDNALQPYEMAWLQTPPGATPRTLPAPLTPLPTARPVLSGTPVPGQTLSCTNGTWAGNPNSITYSTEWQRAPRATTADDDPAWSAIPGGTGANYLVQPVDSGSRVRCRVTRSDAGGSADAVSRSVRADAAAPVNTGPPALSGVPASGAAPGMTCSPGTWDNGPDLTYQWLRDGTPIAGATNPSYVPTPSRSKGAASSSGLGDGGQDLSCRVAAANDVGAAAATSATARIVDDIPLNTTPPRVTWVRRPAGVSDTGAQARCEEGQWVDGYGIFRTNPYVYRYEWLRNGTAIPGADGPRYTFTDDDLGRSIACRVTDVNPLGSSVPVTSAAERVELPTGPSSAKVFRAGGFNSADPTNLLALTDRYLDAVNYVVATRLQRAVDAYTENCRKTYKGATTPLPGTTKVFLTAARCRTLLYDTAHVSVTFRGVRFLGTGCTPFDERATPANPPCPNLGFKVPAVDPTAPPSADADVLAAVADTVPKKILWDIDGNGTTDAVCPGSAPVLRTILGDGVWSPRAVIVDSISETSLVYPNVKMDPFRVGTTSAAPGVLRSSQVRVCATSIVNPPNPEKTPCVTDGNVGRVHVTGNLCPIDVREINPADYAALDPELRAMLQAASEGRLSGEGALTARVRERDTVWVPLSPGAPTLQGGPPRRGGARAAGELRTLTALNAGLNNTAASLSSLGSVSTRFSSQFLKKLDDIPGFDSKNTPFVMDQVYIATGTGMTLNGVSIQPLADSLGLLIPSDVRKGFDRVRRLIVSARNPKVLLGQLTDPGAIPLNNPGELFQQTVADINKTAVLTPPDLNFNALAARLKGAAGKLNLGPFKLTGDATVTIDGGGTATLRAYAELPSLKVGPAKANVRTDVTIKGDETGRLQLQGLRLKVGQAYLGGARLQDLDLGYDAGTLSIRGLIEIPPPASAGIDIKEFRVNSDGPRALRVDYIAGPGGGIQVGPGVFITRLGGGFDRDTDILQGEGALSIGPSAGGGCPIAGFQAEFQTHLAELFSIDATGRFEAACIPMLDVKFHADQTGYITLAGGIDWNAGPLYLKGSIGGAILLPNWQVGMNAKGGIKGIPIVGDLSGEIKVVITNRGFAACGTASVFGADASVGASVRFSNGRPPFTLVELLANLDVGLGCDVDDFRTVVARTAARAAQAGATGFTVPAGGRPLVVSLEGPGAAPRVILRAPDGRTYDLSDATGDAGKVLDGVAGSVLASEARSLVMLAKPAAGRWTAETAPGSPPITRVQEAAILPKPRVTATVGGRGTRRVLRYRVAAIAGQTVRFVERGRDAQTIITTVRGGGTGTAAFTLSEASAPQRIIEAQVVQNGLPRANLTVARFTAPSPRIAAPKVRVRRARSRVIVSWNAVPRARAYEVTAAFTDGRRALYAPRRGRRSIAIGPLARGGSARVTVVAFSPVGRRSPLGRATLRASRRR